MTSFLNPFGFIPDALRGGIWAVAVVLCALFMVVLGWVGPPRLAQQLERTRNGMELEALLGSWRHNGTHGRERATRNFAIDYLFIPTYVVALGLACLAISDRFAASSWSTVALVVGWSTYVLAIADVAENTLLLRILHGGYSANVITAATAATRVKLGILFLDLLFRCKRVAMETSGR